MAHGKEVAKELRKGHRGGIPWSVFLAPNGSEIITADALGPGKGNIGFPVKSEEIAHFIVMLQAAQKKMTDGDLAIVEAALTASSDKINAARERARRARERKKR